MVVVVAVVVVVVIMVVMVVVVVVVIASLLFFLLSSSLLTLLFVLRSAYGTKQAQAVFARSFLRGGYSQVSYATLRRREPSFLDTYCTNVSAMPHGIDCKIF